MVSVITHDFTEQERALARALYASERFGDHKAKVEVIPPLYALLVKSLRKKENLKGVLKALRDVGESNGL